MANQEDVLTLTYDLQLYLIPQVGKFPREHKFMLGDRIYGLLMTLQEDVIEAYYSGKAQKRGILKRVNLHLEKLRFQMRLCKDLRCLSIRKYEHVSTLIDQLGRVIGGWIKSLSS